MVSQASMTTSMAGCLRKGPVDRQWPTRRQVHQCPDSVSTATRRRPPPLDLPTKYIDLPEWDLLRDGEPGRWVGHQINPRSLQYLKPLYKAGVPACRRSDILLLWPRSVASYLLPSFPTEPQHITPTHCRAPFRDRLKGLDRQDGDQIPHHLQCPTCGAHRDPWWHAVSPILPCTDFGKQWLTCLVLS